MTNRLVTALLLLAAGALGTTAYLHPDLLALSSRKPVAPKWIERDPTAAGSPLDESLADAQYRNLGVPNADQNWSQDDLATAVLKLSALAASHPEQLPRYQSAKSGRVFSKLVDPQSLGLLEPKSVEALRRSGRLSNAFMEIAELAKSYQQIPPSYGARYDDSAIEMMGAELRIVKVLLEDGREMLAQYSTNDPSYPDRAASYGKMEKSASLVSYAAILEVGDARKQGSGISQRLRLFEYCEETIPAMASRFSAENRNRITHLLEIYTEDQSPDPLDEKLGVLRREIDAATIAATTQP